MPDQLNTAPYDSVATSLTGGRRHKRSGKRGTTSRRSHSRKRAQAGGLFPGLGGIVQQALVPFGLYALQHSMKKRSHGHIGSTSSGTTIKRKSYGRFRRSSRR